jgi:hypothetical protein
MSGGEWIVEVTRTVRLAVHADDADDAVEEALGIAWDWLPEQAHRGDQGSATAKVTRAGDLS